MTAVEDYFGHVVVGYEERAGEVAFVPPAVMQIETGQDFYTANSLSTITLDLDVQRAFDVRLRIGKVTTAPVFAVSGVGATALKWPGGAQPAMSGETLIRFYGNGSVVYGMLVATRIRRQGGLCMSNLKGVVTGASQTVRLTPADSTTLGNNVFTTRAGVVERFCTELGRDITAGTLTARLYKNDALTGDTVVFDSSFGLLQVHSWIKSLVVAAGDALGVDIVTSADFNYTGMGSVSFDFCAAFEVIP